MCFFSPSALFFYNDTATTDIYTLSLHDALPIFHLRHRHRHVRAGLPVLRAAVARRTGSRSEEHTSELQSQSNLVCRLLLEKKNIILMMYLLRRMEWRDLPRDMCSRTLRDVDVYR